MTSGMIAMVCLSAFAALAWVYVHLRQLRYVVLETWLDELVQDCQSIVHDPRASSGARAVALLCADMVADEQAGKRLVVFIIKRRLGISSKNKSVHGSEAIKEIVKNAPKPVRKKIDDFMLKSIGALFLRSPVAFWFFIVPILTLQGMRDALRSVKTNSYMRFQADFLSFAGRRFG